MEFLAKSKTRNRETMNFDNYLFRCSSIGKLMTDSDDSITDKQLQTIKDYSEKQKLTDIQKKELDRLIEKRDNPTNILSKTTRTYLTELFIKDYFGREKELENKYLTKGIECEQDSLSLLSDVRGVFMKKNKQRFKNEWLTGEPDINNEAEDENEDIKNNWSLFTFIEADITKDYDLQLEGYCLLNGRKKKRLTYTLCNTPAHQIDAEKKRLSYKFDTDSPTFADKCKQLEINSIFDLGLFMKENPDYHFHSDISEWHYDIPATQRIKSFEVPRKSEDEIKKLYERIIESRKFLNSLSQKFNLK